jgi:hypothetical protein
MCWKLVPLIPLLKDLLALHASCNVKNAVLTIKLKSALKIAWAQKLLSFIAMHSPASPPS